MKPPSGGPMVRPRVTAIMFRPRARPRSWGGKAAVTMAALVARIMAPPMPCNTRPAMRNAPLRRKGHQHGEDTKEQHAKPVSPVETPLLPPPAGGDEEDGDDEDVGGLHPEGFAEVQLQIGGNGGEGDGQDARIERGDEQPDRGYDQHPPAKPAQLGCRSAHDAPPRHVASPRAWALCPIPARRAVLRPSVARLPRRRLTTRPAPS